MSITNNSVSNQNRINNAKKTDLEHISPWLVSSDAISTKKEKEKSKIPQLKTVITTELWERIEKFLAKSWRVKSQTVFEKFRHLEILLPKYFSRETNVVFGHFDIFLGFWFCLYQI